MISIIDPINFKTVPWKNGLGETIEIAINAGGTLESFDWRLSMASVVEDGIFSNFANYTRNLILIEGNGISLQHNDNKIDRLTKLLDMATFDGGCKTVGNLHAGAITDFNVITRSSLYNTNVQCYSTIDNLVLHSSTISFVFSLDTVTDITIQSTNDSIQLPAQHLIKISDTPTKDITIKGRNLIVIELSKKNS